MKIKTSELKGTTLDYAVAVCEDMIDKDKQGYFVRWGQNGTALYTLDVIGDEFFPSSNWSQAGQIIEREGITLYAGVHLVGGNPGAQIYERNNPKVVTGDTPLQAAMRCYVASKLGDEVDVPEEVVG